jgi:hypothetical protein
MPALASLADKHRLAVRDVRMVGDDVRIVARLVDPDTSGQGR